MPFLASASTYFATADMGEKVSPGPIKSSPYRYLDRSHSRPETKEANYFRAELVQQ